MRVLEDFFYALRDVRLSIRLVTRLVCSEGIFERGRHVERLKAQSTTERMRKASKKRRFEDKSLSYFVSLLSLLLLRFRVLV